MLKNFKFNHCLCHPTNNQSLDIMQNSKQRILRLRSVLDKTGDSRSGLYLKVSKGVFPKPIKLSARSVGWLEGEVDNWINQRIAVTRGKQ